VKLVPRSWMPSFTKRLRRATFIRCTSRTIIRRFFSTTGILNTKLSILVLAARICTLKIYSFPEIVGIWSNIDSPTDLDLDKALNEAGLKSVEILESSKPLEPKLKKRRATKNVLTRRHRVTNTHLEIDFMKSYMPPK
jgi:hypothetical protein